MKIFALKPAHAAGVVFLVSNCLAGLAAKTTGAWQWNRQRDSVALMSGEQIVWRLNYGTIELPAARLVHALAKNANSYQYQFKMPRQVRH